MNGRSDEALQALIADRRNAASRSSPRGRRRGRVHALPCARLQPLPGRVLRPPARRRGPGTGALASLNALSELTSAEASFEDLERIIGADVGLSLALLRHVNSAYFALPRKIDSVREALTLLGTKAVRRWATVVALSSSRGAGPGRGARAVAGAHVRAAGRAPGRGRPRRAVHRRPAVGRGRAAGRPDGGVLVSLPLSDEITGALLRHEGRRGRILGTVLRYEQGRFPTEGATRRARRGLPGGAALGGRDGSLGRLMSRMPLRFKLTLAFTGVMAVLLASPASRSACWWRRTWTRRSTTGSPPAPATPPRW